VISTPISDVALIKVQGKGASHQIFIYLKRGAEMNFLAKSLNKILIHGYEKNETVWMPDYLKDRSLYKPGSDTRTIMYWGNLLFPESQNNKVEIKYFTNDVSKSSKLILFGVNSDSTPIYFEKEF